eukprot:m.235790 g.235790  ORF g.235790 m.235790 type:complete len:358 (+) comp40129_c1_seq8:310-1383(+)
MAGQAGDEVLKRQALGRSCDLGCLYDGRTDSFVSGAQVYSGIPESALKKIDTNHIEATYTSGDSFDSKFSSLGIGAELKISVLGGLLELAGSAKYLSSHAESKNTATVSLVVKLLTVTETIDVLGPQLEANTIAISGGLGTHVVSEVQWGANAVVTFSTTVSKEEDVTNISAKLKASLPTIGGFAAGGSIEFDRQKGNAEFMKRFTVHVDADVLPAEGMPQSADEAMEFIKEIPALAKKANDGKGQPIAYGLFPLSRLPEKTGFLGRIAAFFRKKPSFVFVKPTTPAMHLRIEQAVEERVEKRNVFKNEFDQIEFLSEVIQPDDLKEIQEFEKESAVEEASFMQNLRELWFISDPAK